MKLLLPILLFSICAQAQTKRLVEISREYVTVDIPVSDGMTYKYKIPSDSARYFNPGIDKYEATVTFKKLGVVTPQPPIVTVNIDDRDPAIIYTGNWDKTCNTCVDNFNNTISFSNHAGNSFEYTFTGKSITWIGERVSTHGIAGIKIDSQPEETYDLYSAQPKKKEVIFKKGWETSGTHKVVIRVTGQKNNASSGFYVVNDMFIVEK